MTDIITLSHYATPYELDTNVANPNLANIQTQLSHPNFFVFGEPSAIDLTYVFGNAQADAFLMPNNVDNFSAQVENVQIHHDTLLGLSDLVQSDVAVTDKLITNVNPQSNQEIDIAYDIYQHNAPTLLVQTDTHIL